MADLREDTIIPNNTLTLSVQRVSGYIDHRNPAAMQMEPAATGHTG